MKKDLIAIKDLQVEEIEALFDLATELKAHPSAYHDELKGKTLGLIFQKPSNRTRVSFEVGMYQLGGYSIYLGPDDIKLGVRESSKDIALTLSRYLDVIVARTYAHKDMMDLAENATIPVINGLSDLAHPCQALADVFTMREKFGKGRKVKVAFIGDANNVMYSLLNCCAKIGISMSVVTPKGYGPKKEILEGLPIEVAKRKEEAVKDADVIYTDVWVSMGHEKEKKKRSKAFRCLQIDSKLVKQAKPDCVVMHCLPAHRGEEITDEVIDGKHSIVFDQAENRLHIQKAVLLSLLEGSVK